MCGVWSGVCARVFVCWGLWIVWCAATGTTVLEVGRWEESGQQAARRSNDEQLPQPKEAPHDTIRRMVWIEWSGVEKKSADP